MVDVNINHLDARKYWQNIDADVNGMLGGFPYISRVDLQGSKNFLAKLGVGGKSKKNVGRTVDCGAGIGRITEGLLLKISETVDIVEPIAKFSDGLKGKEGIGKIFNVGLEDWSPAQSDGLRYDLIWNQWCLGHLTDLQLVSYFEKCKKALRVGGLIIVKENMSTTEEDIFDELDSSVTRTDQKFRKIYDQAGLNIKKTEIQNGLPNELYPVRTYALQPASAQ
ncbi:X-Pro-Lys N-terminal methyltransferase 1 [Hyphodiscus hymeniophilus]|uniref:Alpha N-terminal protein methyltransferase 1 n=1 Tax=Hyphodiscus hymeniophilus TaxID=353542 RepID=A0A9P7AWL4_9HELO|nr:X-Pro-Lys N-terminal methyltransferase 1 [Hyphodiscus hymeniophilus]